MAQHWEPHDVDCPKVVAENRTGRDALEWSGPRDLQSLGWKAKGRSVTPCPSPTFIHPELALRRTLDSVAETTTELDSFIADSETYCSLLRPRRVTYAQVVGFGFPEDREIPASQPEANHYLTARCCWT